MTFFEELPSIEDRALNAPSRQMLTAMQDLQRSYITPSPAKIARKCGWSGERAASVAVVLENAGLVELTYNGPYAIKGMKLTDKGREEIGENRQKPLA